ncbi:MAG: glycosyltransferase [Candidatus Aegiribacteria sp.]|nr:glycosyltransferase [Candidatus Aegiribacteria sp.]MBD3294004.1 glycosyltransferase [Candidatus Fermentibacteria bacterium]
MKISAVLVNYGQWELTRRCVESLEASIGVDVLITLVDNCSPGDIPGWVMDRRNLRFYESPSNTGFAGGCNTGFELSLEDGSEYTLFLNNDALVFPDTLENMTRHLENDPDAGILAPAVYWESDPRKLWSGGGDLVPWKMRYEQISISESDIRDKKALNVDFVSGCALMTRTELFESVGGFREEFFMYYEDADLCRKVKDRGYSVKVLPWVRVLHEAASSSGGELSRLALYFSERNRIFLSREVLPPLTRAVFLFYKTLVLVIQTFKFALWQGPGLIPWIWRGFIDGLAGRTGFSHVIHRLV